MEDIHPSMLPLIGEWVNFVLQGGPCEGQFRRALCTGRFVDDLSGLPKLAKRYGRSEAECLNEFGMHAHLTVQLEPGDLPGVAETVFDIRAVRYNDRKTLGTWHWPEPDDETAGA